MKRWNSLFSLALAFWLPNAACSFAAQNLPENPSEQAGTRRLSSPVLIHATEWQTFTQKELAAKLLPYGIVPLNGAKIFKLTYTTQSLDESAITASGIIIVPDTKQALYPWVSLQHGTISALSEAPSADAFEGLAEASQGFVAVIADYIGYGASSELPHPYIIEKGYQTSLVDMLRAAREFATREKINLGPFFLKGYSEGGYATLALQKELELNHAEEFPIVASAPSAGPYDPDLTGRIVVSKPVVHPVNIPFVALSYNYWLADNQLTLDEIFQPSSALLQDAFSGVYDTSEIFQLLPTASSELFQTDFQADFLAEQPQLPLAQKLHALLQSQSLLKDWQPKVPTRFYHCTDDEEIPVEVTQAALTAFQTQGVKNISSVIIPSPDPARPYTHTTCPAIFSPIAWFGSILIPKAP